LSAKRWRVPIFTNFFFRTAPFVKFTSECYFQFELGLDFALGTSNFQQGTKTIILSQSSPKITVQNTVLYSKMAKRKRTDEEANISQENGDSPTSVSKSSKKRKKIQQSPSPTSSKRLHAERTSSFLLLHPRAPTMIPATTSRRLVRPASPHPNNGPQFLRDRPNPTLELQAPKPAPPSSHPAHQRPAPRPPHHMLHLHNTILHARDRGSARYEREGDSRHGGVRTHLWRLVFVLVGGELGRAHFSPVALCFILGGVAILSSCCRRTCRRLRSLSPSGRISASRARTTSAKA